MLRVLLLALVGAGAFAAVYFATEPQPAPLAQTPTKTASLAKDAPADPVPISFELRPGAPDAPGSASESVTAAIRDVTPANMTAGPPVSGLLARVESTKTEEPPAATPEGRKRLFNPVIESAGVIDIGARVIRIAGVAAPEADKRCGAGPGTWPCGRMARAALRRFIRGRAIECAVPAGADAIPDSAQCFVAEEDIAEWLVAQGWAEPDGEALADAGKRARAAKLGLWSDGWPGGQPAELAAGN
jgi:endonuclease YncB( thermonuclease family)